MAIKLYVGGLAYSVNEKELEEMCTPFGKVLSAIIKDRDSGQSKGFGFVEMQENADGQTVIKELHGKEISGRALTVNEARPQEDRRPSNGGGSFRKSY